MVLAIQFVPILQPTVNDKREYHENWHYEKVFELTQRRSESGKEAAICRAEENNEGEVGRSDGRGWILHVVAHSRL